MVEYLPQKKTTGTTVPTNPICDSIDISKQKELARKEIATTIEIHINNGNGNTLLINPTFGVGKTVTTVNTLIKNKKWFCILQPYHEQVDNLLEDKNLLPNDIVHLEGRNRICINDKLKLYSKHKINIQKSLCDKTTGLCPHKVDCPYLKQFNIIQKDRLNIATVNHYLNTKFLQELGLDVIVIDEYPFNSFTTTTTISFDNLHFLDNVVLSDLLDTKYVIVQNYIIAVQCIINALKHVLEYTKMRSDENKKLKGKYEVKVELEELVDEFFKFLPQIDEIIYHMSIEKARTIFIDFYNEYIVKMITNKKEVEYEGFNNIYDAIEKIFIVFCEYKGKNVNLPIVSLSDKKQKISMKFRDFVFVLPENVVTIILDATAKQRHYERVMKTNVNMCTPQYETSSKMIELTNAKYTATTLKDRICREHLFSSLIKFCDKYDMPVYVFSMKGFTTIKNETDETKGMSFERYLLDKKIKNGRYTIKPYSTGKGRNIKDFVMGDGAIILMLGTPTLPPNESVDTLRAYLVGEEVISNKRIVEEPLLENGQKNPLYQHDCYYENIDYADFVETNRENILEHTSARTRGHPDSIIIKASCLPINYPEENITKMSLKEFNKHFGLNYYDKNTIIIKALKWIDKGKMATQFYNKFTRRKNISLTFGSAQDFKQCLLDKKLIKITKKSNFSKISLTSTGKNLKKTELEKC